MNHCNLPVGNAECFSVHKAFDGCKLIEEHQVDVLNVVVNGVKVDAEETVFKWVDSFYN